MSIVGRFSAASQEITFLDIVPEQGMSGGALVDSQCGVLGVIQSRGVFGEGGVFVRLCPIVV